MSAEVIEIGDRITDEQNRLFYAWRDAHVLAQETMNLHDGIAAGKAWARFMRSFEPVAQPSANVVRFGPRRTSP
jgi:hypothetical protein